MNKDFNHYCYVSSISYLKVFFSWSCTCLSFFFKNKTSIPITGTYPISNYKMSRTHTFVIFGIVYFLLVLITYTRMKTVQCQVNRCGESHLVLYDINFLIYEWFCIHKNTIYLLLHCNLDDYADIWVLVFIHTHTHTHTIYI